MTRIRGAMTSRKAIVLISVLFSLIVLLSLSYNYRKISQHARGMALTEARTIHELNLAYRRWNAGHGGVYVPVTDSMQPNPYLSSSPRRDLLASDGTRLTLVNPAMMTRQVHTILTTSPTHPIINKVTSLKFINPANAPDEWEIRALRSFEEGKGEASELTTVGDQPYMRLLKPYFVEKGCLTCHAFQRYELGDVRGGLSVGVPMRPYLEHMAEERRDTLVAHLLILAIGMCAIGVLGVLVKRAERNYATERDFTETAINIMPGAFFVLNERGRYVRWNKAVAWFWGEESTGLSGKEGSAIVHPADLAGYAAAMAEALRVGFASAEARLVPQTGGDARHYYLTGRKMLVEGLTYLVVSGIDITQRKSMEEKLQAAAVEWAASFDAIHECILILDPDYRILRCNAATTGFFGKTEAQLQGQRCCELMHGDRIPATCPVVRSLEGKKAESEVLEINGKTCLVGADPILDATGKVVRIVHTINDITEQKRLEAQLLQAQKMEAVGTLAGGVAHDFNNVLSAIVGYASLLQLKTAPDDPRRQYAENILASTERATILTRSLLSFGRKQATELKSVSLNEVVTGFQKILARLIGEDIAFTITCFPGELVIEADRGQIEQVLMNLVTNARDAMPKGGRLQICTERADFARDSGDITSGTYAVITVSDTGHGMDKRTQDHIFEPFFTTKEVGKGTGLGLAIVYGIVKKHNGAIHVYSEQGLGTTFKVLIPISHSTATLEDRRAAPVSLPDGSGTILLVEDDVQTREVARVLLNECGYTVLTAADGEEGVRVFREQGDRIQLVLTDLIMPKKSGREAFEEMNRIRPGIKTIFMSGYSMDIIEEKGLLEHGMNFLSKPLSPNDLLGMVRTVLASRGVNGGAG